MTIAQQAPPPQIERPDRSQAPRTGRWSGFSHILMARLKELKREPEVIFWVFAFPVLLALGLGIAFRNKPTDVTSIAVVAGPQAQPIIDMLQGSPQKSTIHAEVLDREAALKGFRLGKYDLIVTPAENGGFHYHYDPARQESVLSRAEVDDVLQASAGRKNPLPTSATPSSEP